MPKVEWGALYEWLLLPSDFRWRDEETGIVHHGARITRDGHADLDYTVLCTDVLGWRWKEKPADVPATLTCIGCLGAREQP